LGAGPTAQQVRADDVRNERDAGQIYSQRLPLPPPSAVAVAVRLLGRASNENA
jgi:hypothetical protein